MTVSRNITLSRIISVQEIWKCQKRNKTKDWNTEKGGIAITPARGDEGINYGASVGWIGRDIFDKDLRDEMDIYDLWTMTASENLNSPPHWKGDLK